MVGSTVLYVIAVAVVLLLIYSASAMSTRTMSMASGPAPMTPDEVPKPPAEEGFASVKGAPTSGVAGTNAPIQTHELLPSPTAPMWGNDTNPNDLLAGNFLDPGRMTGVNQVTRFKTVPNMQLRSDPVITTKWDSPYNQTPDLVANTRPEFEIGRRPDYAAMQGESTGRS